MFITNVLLAIGTMVVFAGAIPSKGAWKPDSFRKRACSSPIGPDMMFTLDEARTTFVPPANNTIFRLSQKAGTNGSKSVVQHEMTTTFSQHRDILVPDLPINPGHATARQYLLVHFAATPYGSAGCELSWNPPDGLPAVPLQVKATAYDPPFRPTWSSISTQGGFSGASPVAQGSLVKTACSNGPPPGAVGGGYGLAYVFKLADTLEAAGTAASVSFDVAGLKGPVLRYDC